MSSAVFACEVLQINEGYDLEKERQQEKGDANGEGNAFLPFWIPPGVLCGIVHHDKESRRESKRQKQEDGGAAAEDIADTVCNHEIQNQKDAAKENGFVHTFL